VNIRQVRRLKLKLFHAELDRFDRIGRVDSVMFLFVGFECVTSTSSRSPFAVFGFASQSLSISLRVSGSPVRFDEFESYRNVRPRWLVPARGQGSSEGPLAGRCRLIIAHEARAGNLGGLDTAGATWPVNATSIEMVASRVVCKFFDGV
jgi:hypothetical protein